MIAALTELEFLSDNIENAYLTAPCRENSGHEQDQNLDRMKEF